MRGQLAMLANGDLEGKAGLLHCEGWGVAGANSLAVLSFHGDKRNLCRRGGTTLCHEAN